MSTLEIKDCTLTLLTTGQKTANGIAELADRVRECPLESLTHHFCHTQLRRHFSEKEFRNDLSIWASERLHDRVLAERLGSLNPFTFDSVEALRSRVLEILERRIEEADGHTPPQSWRPFRFMKAIVTVYPTPLTLKTPSCLARYLPEMSWGSLYYHFIDIRTTNGDRRDDFTRWLQTLDEPPERLIRELDKVDFYFPNFEELRGALIRVTREALSGD